MLLLLLLAGCGGGPALDTPTPNPFITPGNIPLYPKLDGVTSNLDSKSFPQAGQYDSVQAFTFSSIDDSAAIRLWYKDQLTSKGWQVVADGTTLLGLTTANRDKLIEMFFTSRARASTGTHVIVYYATGRKSTPTPLKSAGRGLTNSSLMRIIKRTQQRSSAVERWPSG